MPELRDYQIAAIDSSRERFRSGDRAVCVTMPTGAGKTVFFAALTRLTSAKGKRVLILAHRHELLVQIGRALRAERVDFGMIAPDAERTRHAVQVGSAPTVSRRLATIDPFDVIVIDECHHAVSPTFTRIFDAMPNAIRLGVSATPVRLDGKGLTAVFDSLVSPIDVAELIRRGFLARPRVFAPPHDFDVEGMRRTAGDFNRADLEERTNRPTVTGEAVEHYQRLCPGASALVFAVSIKHAEALAASFRAIGVRAENLDGTMTTHERSRIVNGFASGAIKIITSCEILSEGFDVPGARAAILVRPTASETIYRQQIGRVMRRKDDGDNTCLILDMVGNVKRHGMPDEVREWSLEGKSARAANAGPATKQCPQCFCVNAAAVMHCAECGFSFGDRENARERNLAHRDGTLTEITPEMLARIRERKARAREEYEARTFEQLVELGRARGYNFPERWAQHRMAARGRRRG
jgi:superfamily II DNA or RNA helicase